MGDKAPSVAVIGLGTSMFGETWIYQDFNLTIGIFHAKVRWD